MSSQHHRIAAVLISQLILFALVLQSDGAFLGARKILADLKEAPAGEEKKTDPAAKWVEDSKMFSTASAGLAPEEAAAQWLSLLEALLDLPADPSRQNVYGREAEEVASFATLFARIPPPKAWQVLSDRIQEQDEGEGRSAVRQYLLRLLGHLLIMDADAGNRDLANVFRQAEKSEGRNLKHVVSSVNNLASQWRKLVGDWEGQIDELQKKIKAPKKGRRYGPEYLNVPDLVTLVGRKKAEAMLDQALRADFSIHISHGDETKVLAREIALALLEHLKSPQWQLTYDLNASELFEAMEKKFIKVEEEETPTDEGEDVSGGDDASDMLEALMSKHGGGRGDVDHAYTQARFYYLLGLIVHQRTDEARALAQEIGKASGRHLPINVLTDLDRIGYTRSVYAFLDSVLPDNPDLPYWKAYVGLGARAGETERTLATIERVLDKDDLTSLKRIKLKEQRMGALLADDQVDEGVEQLQEILKYDPGEESEEARDYVKQRRPHLAIQLAWLGHLLDRPEWLRAGLAERLKTERGDDKASQKSPGASEMEFFSGLHGAYLSMGMMSHEMSLLGRVGQQSDWSYVSLLLELGRGEIAEAYVAGFLQREASRKPDDNRGWHGDAKLPLLLVQLAAVYYESGRFEDILYLVDHSPDWGAGDLAKCFQQTVTGSYYGHKTSPDSIPLGLIVATALHSDGRDTEAIKILEELLYVVDGFDPIYELYVELKGGDAIPFLDELHRRNQFQERPLIWKAHLLRKQGKLEEAEAVAKAAISIDPSDGEQGRGLRMRVYREMGAIQEAMGNTKDAAFFEDVMKAIRLAEDADRVHARGLLKRGIEMYREALGFFADAYCIQSRLAVQLEAAGDFEAAEAHYRRAYELMPDSFGRVESHCFGCEGVFNSERAQGVAERVFMSLVKERPENPRVHYLLGYLRENQGRHRDALPLYRTAVELDPEYYNAWSHIGGLGGTLQLSPEDRDDVVINQIRLDPLGRQGRGQVSMVWDLARLWEALQPIEGLVHEAPEALLAMPASAERLEEKETAAKQAGVQMSDPHFSGYRQTSRMESRDPGKVIARHVIVSQLAQILQQLETMSMHMY